MAPAVGCLAFLVSPYWTRWSSFQARSENPENPATCTAKSIGSKPRPRLPLWSVSHEVNPASRNSLRLHEPSVRPQCGIPCIPDALVRPAPVCLRLRDEEALFQALRPSFNQVGSRGSLEEDFESLDVFDSCGAASIDRLAYTRVEQWEVSQCEQNFEKGHRGESE